MKRGYSKISNHDKERLLRTYLHDRNNFKTFCDTMGIKYNSGHRTVMRALEQETHLVSPKNCWGGKRYHKIENEHIDFLINKLEDDPLLDLNDLKSILSEARNIEVDKSTISLHLKNRSISYKKCYSQPITSDTIFTKEKRFEYAQRYMRDISNVDKCIWVDETNIGVWSHCSRGRAAVGNKAVIKSTASKGANLNMIMAVSHDGIVHHMKLMSII